MQKITKILLSVGVVALIVAGVVLLALRLLDSPHPSTGVPATGELASAASPQPIFPAATKPLPPTESTQTDQAAAFPSAVPKTDANTITNWEDSVDSVIGSDDENTNKVKRLFELFPQLPEAGKIEVAQHLSNLVPDSDYAPLGEILKNAQQPEPVLDVLLADALNRPNGLKLPLLLDVAQSADNPKAAQAKDILGLYLDGDFGADWTTWQQKMQQWLKDNPD